MDANEATKIVFSRIQRLEPENATKIIGYLYLQDNTDQDMIRLAFGPDGLLQSFISRARKDLGLQPTTSSIMMQISPNSSFRQQHSQQQQQQQQQQQLAPLYWCDRPASVSSPSLGFSEDYMSYHPNSHSLGFEHLREDNSNLVSFMNARSGGIFPDYGYPDVGIYGSSKFTAADFQGDSLNLVSLKPCLYFARGYCKHGINCRFLHGYSGRTDAGVGGGGAGAVPISPTESRNSLDDFGFQGGSLERLEVELQELLRGKKVPVSIASLPQLYYEKYGKTLQAEGYLTESQRHGKAGYSLTKLLARLKNTVTLIDRPHGQHAVVLAEEAHKYLSSGSSALLDDLSGANSGSRQIYLTFPAESTFTEEDVSNYFRNYGPVQDVRIPYQQKRMFGFVTFVYSETVKTILAKGNPHYVCGARVLVKPYREKGKLAERKNLDRGEQSKHFVLTNLDFKDYDHLQLGPRLYDNSEIIRKHMKDQEQVLELERVRFSELRLGDSHQQRATHIQFGSSNENSASKISQAVLQQQFSNGLAESEAGLRASEDLSNFPANDHFRYLLDVLENNDDHDSSGGHNLPESPFANLISVGLSSGGSGGGKPSSSPDTSSSLKPNDVLAPFQSAVTVMNKELACSLCLGTVVQPKKLDCNHVFCSSCQEQVSKMSSMEECPICVQWNSNQYFKLPDTMDLHDFSGNRALPTSNVVW